jgi:hypothetical protein
MESDINMFLKTVLLNTRRNKVMSKKYAQAYNPKAITQAMKIIPRTTTLFTSNKAIKYTET